MGINKSLLQILRGAANRGGDSGEDEPEDVKGKGREGLGDEVQ